MQVRWLPALFMVVAVAICTTASSGCKKTETVKGEGGRELTLTVPNSVTLNAGGSEKVKFSVERKGFDEPVDITISDLPKGVHAKDSKINIGKGSHDVEVIIEADADAAKVENHVATVKASSGETSVSETTKVTVNEKK